MPNCIFGCAFKPGVILHRFPNPKLDPNRLQEWRNIIGEFSKGLDDQTLYLRSRVCHKHFEKKYWNRNNRINRMAIPTLFLPDSHKIFKTPAQTEIPIEFSNANSCIPREENEVYTENIVDNNLCDEVRETTDETSTEVFKPNIDCLRKNSVAVKYASVQMSIVDIHICGECHSVFHFIQQFKEHKESVACSSISPYRDTKASISNTWAFLLWKSSTLVPHVGDDGNSQLMKKWNELPEKTRDIWITASRQVLELSKYADFELESAAQIQSKQADLENSNEDPLLQELKSDHEENSDSNGSVKSEQDPLSIEPKTRMPKWYSIPEEPLSTSLETRKSRKRRRHLQETQLQLKPCAVVLQDISKQLQGQNRPLTVKPFTKLMADYIHKHINAKRKKSQRPSSSTTGQGGTKMLRTSKILTTGATQKTTLKSRKTPSRARPVTLQPSSGLLTESRLAPIRNSERISRDPHSRPRILKSSKTCQKQKDVQYSTVANKEPLNPGLVNQRHATNSENIQLPASESQELPSNDVHFEGSLVEPASVSFSKQTEVEKSQDLDSQIKKNQLRKSAIRVLRNRPWRANFKMREKKPVSLWKLPSGLIMKGTNELMEKMKLMENVGTQIDEAKHKKVYYVMEKDKLDEGLQVEKASLFIQKYNEVWKKNKLPVPAALEEEIIPANTEVKSTSPLASEKNKLPVPAALEKEIIPANTEVKSTSPPTGETRAINNSQVVTLGLSGSEPTSEIVQKNQPTNQEDKRTATATEETQIPIETTNNDVMEESSEEPSKEKRSEHAYSKCPLSTGPIVRKPVVCTRVFPIPPIVNNGIILTSWGVNNRYLEQTSLETPISSPLQTTDVMKIRKKKSVSKELEDQYFRNLGPLPSPSPEPDLTLCPLTGELLAPVEEAEGQVEMEEMIVESALDDDHDNISLPSMPMLLEGFSFNE